MRERIESLVKALSANGDNLKACKWYEFARKKSFEEAIKESTKSIESLPTEFLELIEAKKTEISNKLQDSRELKNSTEILLTRNEKAYSNHKSSREILSEIEELKAYVKYALGRVCNPKTLRTLTEKIESSLISMRTEVESQLQEMKGISDELITAIEAQQAAVTRAALEEAAARAVLEEAAARTAEEAVRTAEKEAAHSKGLWNKLNPVTKSLAISLASTGVFAAPTSIGLGVMSLHASHIVASINASLVLGAWPTFGIAVAGVFLASLLISLAVLKYKENNQTPVTI